MKKYIPVDFDEKGNAILGTARTTPTSNGFVPTTWAPPAPSGDGNGILSITISPSITTTPALDSMFPIYWEDLTDEEKAEGKKTVLVNTNNLTEGDTYTATITATDTWYAQGDGDWSAQGGSAEDTGTVITPHR